MSAVRDDDLLRRVRLADPLRGEADDTPADADAVLERVVSRPRRAPRRALGRLRAVLVVAFGVSVLLVPAAVGFHRQLLDLVQSPPTTYAGDFPGIYSATVAGLVPTSRNGRWTIGFTTAYPQLGMPRGSYSLSHDRKVVARGECVAVRRRPARCCDCATGAAQRVAATRSSGATTSFT